MVSLRQLFILGPMEGSIVLCRLNSPALLLLGQQNILTHIHNSSTSLTCSLFFPPSSEHALIGVDPIFYHVTRKRHRRLNPFYSHVHPAQKSLLECALTIFSHTALSFLFYSKGLLVKGFFLVGKSFSTRALLPMPWEKTPFHSPIVHQNESKREKALAKRKTAAECPWLPHFSSPHRNRFE